MTAQTSMRRPGFDADLVEALLVVPAVHPEAPRLTTVAPFDGQPLAALPQSTAAVASAVGDRPYVKRPMLL